MKLDIYILLVLFKLFFKQLSKAIVQHMSLAVVNGNAASTWSVCKFDLISAIPSVLTNSTARHLPLFQCIAIAFQTPWFLSV